MAETKLKTQQALGGDGWIAAGETWTYASADSPTFTFTISGDLTTKYAAGQRIKLTQTTTKYFIITAVSYGAPNTTVTIYGGTDYTLANATISSPFYSREKAPFGFPLDPLKWTVTATDSTERAQASPVQNTWYNLGSFTISIPIGSWNVIYDANVYSQDNSTVSGHVWATLSTANNSESDTAFSTYAYSAVTNGTANSIVVSLTRSKYLLIASKTSYYLNERVTTANIDTLRLNVSIGGSTAGVSTIRAVCAYL